MATGVWGNGRAIIEVAHLHRVRNHSEKTRSLAPFLAEALIPRPKLTPPPPVIIQT
jgi:hypothetical protein